MSKKQSILIIEDEYPIATALKLKLEAQGFETQVAGNGEEGIRFLDQHEFDLVLLDLVMPKRDGFSVLEHLQQMNNTVPVIVSTNLNQDEDMDRVKALGAIGYYVKSNTPIKRVVQVVEETLNS